MLNIMSHQESINQNYNELTLHTHWAGYNQQKQTVPSVGVDVEKIEPSYIAGENVKSWSHFGKQFGSSSKRETQNL